MVVGLGNYVPTSNYGKFVAGSGESAANPGDCCWVKRVCCRSWRLMVCLGESAVGSSRRVCVAGHK